MTTAVAPVGTPFRPDTCQDNAEYMPSTTSCQAPRPAPIPDRVSSERDGGSATKPPAADAVPPAK